MTTIETKFDSWIVEPGSFAERKAQPKALQFHNELEAGDPQAIIFPPTYARKNAKEKGGHIYDINKLVDGTLRCALDSVGSQANRLFANPLLVSLLPNVVLKDEKGKLIHMAQITHRAADGALIASDGADECQAALDAMLNGNFLPLAQLDPLSYVGGVWDSRGNLTRFGRIVESKIDAYNISYGFRSAQFNPTVDLAGTDLQRQFGEATEEDAAKTKHPLAQIGLLPAPSVDQHGGIQVHGNILHLASINLEDIRKLSVPNNEPLALRRYILGLCLVAVVTYDDYNLRSGCHLFVKHTKAEILPAHDPLSLDADEVVAYAQKVAADFGINDLTPKKFTFKSALARKLAQKKKEEAAKKKLEKAKKQGITHASV
jgi:CRISPR-associated protein Csb1